MKKRAFLKWAGRKYWLVDNAQHYLPSGEYLINHSQEPGSVFLNTEYKSYILADINNDLIKLYNIIKLRIDNFVRSARVLFNSEYNNAKRFHIIRQEFNSSQDIYRRALLFLYRNRHCYNALCHYNSKNEFNIPFGHYKKPYFPEAELYWFAKKAQYATFTCENYQQTLLNVTYSAVVYCDLPYAPLSTTTNFAFYYSKSFTIKD